MANVYELKIQRLSQLSRAVRRRLDRATGTDAQMVSPGTSCVDLFVSIYGDSCSGSSKSASGNPNGDYVLLAKGFGVHALIATLAQCGLASSIALADERPITRDLCWHPGLAPPGVALRSDTLCGLLAIASELTEDAKQRGSRARAFVIVDAARLEPGFWESLRLTAAQQPESVVLVVYKTEASRGISVPSCSGSFDAFGWDVRQIDGHSLPDLYAALHNEPRTIPRLLVADTAHTTGDSQVHNHRPSWVSNATGTDDGGWVLPSNQEPGNVRSYRAGLA